MRIPLRYPLVEVLTAVLVAGAFVRFARPLEATFGAAVACVLVALAFIDLEHRRVPNVIVLPALAAAVVATAGMGLAYSELRRTLVALACGAGAFALLFVIAVVSGGMGFGDVKLESFVGVALGWFGWEVFALGLFAGFMLGGLVGVAALLLGRSRKDAIPFAPMLCGGAVLALFAGAEPVRAWLGG